MKIVKIILALIIIGLIVCFGWKLYQGKVASSHVEGEVVVRKDTITYYFNPFSYFEVKYPNDVVLLTDETAMAQTGYIPTCDTEYAIACLVFSGEAYYPNSNFDNAGISISIRSDRVTEEECIAIDQDKAEFGEGQSIIFGGRAVKEITKGAETFMAYEAGDAAMSHQSNGQDYRTFRGGKCVELSYRINTTSYEVYPEGEKVRFSDENRAELQEKIDTIIRSFATGVVGHTL